MGLDSEPRSDSPTPGPSVFSSWRTRRDGAGRSFFASLTLHCCVVTAAWNLNLAPAARSFPEPRLAEVLEREERRVVWYAPQTEMPAIDPARKIEGDAERPRFEANQQVAADQSQAQSDRQMIFSDAPDIALAEDVETPNILSWQAPRVERPRSQPQLVAPRLGPIEVEPVRRAPAPAPEQLERLARLRFRQRERAAEPPPKSVPAAPAPPAVKPAEQPEVDMSRFQKLARLRYRARNESPPPAARTAVRPPEPAPSVRPKAPAALEAAPFQQTPRLRYQTQASQRRQAPERQALAGSAAPRIDDAPLRPSLDASQFQQLARLRYQARGDAAPREAPTRRALGEVAKAAPVVRGAAATDFDASQFQRLARLRYQGRSRPSEPSEPQAVALAEAAGGTAPAISLRAGRVETPIEAATPSPPAAPPPSLGSGGNESGGTAGQANLAVVGVRPSDRLPPEIPRGSRRARFSAGPNAAPDGGRVAVPGSEDAPVRIPGLAVRGESSAVAALARSEPRKPIDLASLTRRGGLRDLNGAPHIQAEKAPQPIDLQQPFVGRPVYQVAINMPNVTSFSGNWIMQFAEARPPDEAGADGLEERAAAREDDLTPPWPKTKVDP